MEDSTEILPAHIAELQKLREACGGLGVDVSDAHFAGVISLSIPTPSCDPVIGTLGGVLDPKVDISCLKPSGAGDKDSPPLAKTQTWYSRLAPDVTSECTALLGQKLDF